MFMHVSLVTADMFGRLLSCDCERGVRRQHSEAKFGVGGIDF